MTQPTASPPAQDHHPARSVWSRLSLRTRVAVNVVAVTGLIQLVLGVVIFQFFQATVNDFFDARLATRIRWAATELAREAGPAPRTPDAADLEAVADRTLRIFTLVLVLRDEQGRVIALSDPSVDVSQIPRPGRLAMGEVTHAMAMVPNIGSGDEDRIPARTATTVLTEKGPDGKRTYYLTGAIVNTAAAQMIDLIGRAVVLSSTLGLIATGCAAWLITGLALKPLSQLSTAAQQISVEQLDKPTPIPAAAPEIERLAAELDAARERIRLALQANDRFIANVSHELKTPVAVLRTEAQTLDATDIPPDTRAFVRSVIEETRRLGSIVDSFLTLASVRSGRTLSATRPVYINDVVIDSIAHCGLMARQRGVTITPDLHDGDDDLIVAGDSDLLRVLVDNLVRNAVRFGPPGSTVSVQTTADPSSATISVTDSGPGIPSDVLPTLFERFAQTTSDAVLGRGHGIGLSIAQGIAELHGGLITTVNTPGGGCRFSFLMPRLNLQPTRAPDPGPSAPPGWDQTRSDPSRQVANDANQAPTA